jgi:hypothetical protein
VLFVAQRYPLVNAGRTPDFGNLEIPIPLASNPGVYVTVPDLRADDIYARFMAGKVATVHLAARVVALIVVVHRTRDLVRAMESQGISRPLALQGAPAMEGFEVFER